MGAEEKFPGPLWIFNDKQIRPKVGLKGANLGGIFPKGGFGGFRSGNWGPGKTFSKGGDG